MKDIYFIDLFAGAGGLSEGFIRAGFKPLAHIESDTSACNTLKTRMAYHWLKNNNMFHKYDDYLQGCISREQLYSYVPGKIISSVINNEINSENNPHLFKQVHTLRDKKKIDIIIGGPPCQAYSLVGRSRDKNRMKTDLRNHLYILYAEFLKEFNPEYFIFENVTGLLSAEDKDGKNYLNSMTELFKKIGYTIKLQILNASDYGVLQNRKRVIITGKKGANENFFSEPGKIKFQGVTVSDIFSDLPGLQAGEGNILKTKLKKYKGDYLYDTKIKNETDTITFHISRPHTTRDREIYKIAVQKWNLNEERLNYNDLPERLKTHNNRKSFVDRFKVVAGNMPYSHTVVAHIARDGHYYIHPDIKQLRSLTPREAARLQSFPDDYYFESISEIPGRTAAFRQIGNAVPVLLAEALAKKLREMII